MTETTFISDPKSRAENTPCARPMNHTPAVLETADLAGQSVVSRWNPPSGAPVKSNSTASESYQGRLLWEYANASLRAGNRAEDRIWRVLFLCSVAIVLYAAYCYLAR